MNRKLTLLRSLILLLLIMPSSAHAQAWSGIINATRAVNWQRSNVGVQGGIPSANWAQCVTTACKAVVAGPPSSITADQITAGINSAPPNTYVFLPAGTYNNLGSNGINLKGVKSVVLRGAGPTQTLLQPTGGTACISGTQNICIINSPPWFSRSAAVTPPCGGAGASNCFDWIGGFVQGATSITIANVGSANITNGDVIFLDRANEIADNGGFFNCETTNGAAFVCSQEGGSNSGRLLGGVDAAQTQQVTVTGGCGSPCVGAGPFTLTITPGLYANNWGSSNLVGGWFVKPIQFVGIENLSIDNTNSTARSNFGIQNCNNCWIKNVRSIAGNRNHIWMLQPYRTEIRDSYFFGTKNGSNQSYGIEDDIPGDCLVENNIFQQISSPLIGASGSGSIYAYNFSINNAYAPTSYLQGSYISHDAANSFKLYEGNIFNVLWADADHGNGGLNTVFRNWLNGLDWNQGAHPTQQTNPISWDAYQRGFNVIGNVLGTPGYHNLYEAFPDSAGNGSADTKYTQSQCNQSIYTFGWGGGICGTLGHNGVLDDTLVRGSVMRWGNYDTVNAAVRFDATESSPTAMTYVNAQSTPASQTLPASFYLSSAPSFFGSIPFPPIGPDVTGGNGGTFVGGTYAQGICQLGYDAGGGTCTSNLGGHVNINPAMNCYLNVMHGPPDGSGSALSFDANSCYYGSSGPAPPHPAPAPPTNLATVIH